MSNERQQHFYMPDSVLRDFIILCEALRGKRIKGMFNAQGKVNRSAILRYLINREKQALERERVNASYSKWDLAESEAKINGDLDDLNVK